MKATGWCETCGDVEVEVMCIRNTYTSVVCEWEHVLVAACCQYADCPRCGGDVDQWATS